MIFSLVLLMSLCESVQVWQLEKLQPHSSKEGCYGNVDLMSGLSLLILFVDWRGGGWAA